MKRWISRLVTLSVVAGGFVGVLIAAQQTGLWTLGGQNVRNTRFQSAETQLGVANVGAMSVKWRLETDGDVSATPAVDGNMVYFPDWAGKIYAVNRTTGEAAWTADVPSITGVPYDSNLGGVSRTTPAIAGNALIFGDQGGRLAAGARVFALDRSTGATLWVTVLQGAGIPYNFVNQDYSYTDGSNYAIVTQSPVVDEANPDVVYVGTASWEEAMAAFLPGYQCCTFRGAVFAISTKTGQILWTTSMAPPGYSGNGVWGGTAAIDGPRKALYVTTGNNYSVPADVGTCIANNEGNPTAQAACLDPANYFDAIVGLDINTGAVKWATKALPHDTWNVNCLYELGFGVEEQCPSPAGPDYDFGQGPILFTAKTGGKTRDMLGAGQKSGMFWALDRQTGQVVWSTQVGPGGTMGGLQWGSATDGTRIYAAVNNSFGVSWTPVGSSSATTGGAWTALDPATGAILWQTPTGAAIEIPNFGSAIGAMTVANGVVYGCSFGGNHAAMNAQTGAMLWSFNDGTACGAGASVSRGLVYWGSGYNQILFYPIQRGHLYAFGN